MTSAAGFQITTDLNLIDVEVVHQWLSTDAYWAKGRSRETVEAAAAHSLNFGVLTASEELCGYARVVTDRATFAWVCDVYIDPAARGNGLGVSLAQAIVDELRPLNLKRVMLATNDAHGVYEKVGFVPMPDPQKWMVLAASGITVPVGERDSSATAPGGSGEGSLLP